MVALARSKRAQSGYHAELAVGDAAAPPWQPESFDVVLTRHALWAMADPDAALTRWIDLLAPQGRLVLIVGRWSTGAGRSAAEVSDVVHRHRVEADVTALGDAVLWGEPVRHPQPSGTCHDSSVPRPEGGLPRLNVPPC